MVARFVLLALLVPYAVWLIFAYDYHFLDGVNLLFHEAGHVFFGILGRTIGVAGGTLGQFVFPIACAVHFLRQDQRFEAALMGVWAGENFMYTGRYAADAQAQVLPLVGGHIHDWEWMLSRAGLLEHCELVGGAFHVLGSLVVVGTLALAGSIVASEAQVSRGGGIRTRDAEHPKFRL